MANILTPEEHDRAIKAAQFQALSANPAAIVDLLDLGQNLWAGYGRTPFDAKYAKPLALSMLGQEADLMKFDAGMLVVNALSEVLPGELASGVAMIGGGIRLHRDASAMERRAIGQELLSRDPVRVQQAIANVAAVERAMYDMLRTPDLDRELKQAAQRGISKLVAFRSEHGLPDASTPIPVLLGVNPVLAEKLETLFDSAAQKHDPATEPLAHAAECRKQLEALGKQQTEIKLALEPITRDLEKRLQAEAAAADEARFNRSVAEFVGTGQILGLLIGMHDPRKGKAVSTIFEQGGALMGAVRGMKKALDAGAAIQMANLATGFGAVFAIAGAFSAFGGGAPDPSDAILEAIQAVMGGLKTVSRQLYDLNEDVRNLALRTGVDFAELDAAVAKLWRKLDGVSDTLVLIKFEDIEKTIFDARQQFSLSRTAEGARKLLGTAYATGIFESSRRSQTYDTTAPTELIALVVAPGAEPAPRRAAMNLSNALERYPVVLSLASGWLLEAGLAGPEEAQRMLSLTYGATADLTLQQLEHKNTIHPQITSLSLRAAYDALGTLMLAPRDEPAPLDPAGLTDVAMAGDIIAVASWPRRVVRALDGPEVRKQALSAYCNAYSGLLNWVIDQRCTHTNVCDFLNSQKQRRAVLTGASVVGKMIDATLGLPPEVENRVLLYPAPGNLRLPAEARAFEEGRDGHLWFALMLVARLGHKPVLESVERWVDRPLGAPQPPWLGFGDYHEVFAVKVPDLDVPDRLIVWCYVYMRDPGHSDVLRSEWANYYGQYGRDDVYRDDGVELRSSRFGRVHDIDRRIYETWTEPLNSAPFDNIASDALAGEMSGGDRSLDEFRDDMRQVDGADILVTLFSGQQHDPDTYLRKLVMSRLVEGFSQNAPKLALPSRLVDAVARAWLVLATVELAAIQSDPAHIGMVTTLVRGVPQFLRADQLLASTLASRALQEEFFGERLAANLYKRIADRLDLGFAQDMPGDRYAEANVLGWMGDDGLITLAATHLEEHLMPEWPSLSPLPATTKAIAEGARLELLARQLWRQDGDAV